MRAELNIEKWPAIWQVSKTRNSRELRVMEREIETGDGQRVRSRVEVGFTHLGTLTTEEQKLLYVLYKLWEESGKPDAQIFFSSRALARQLRKGWGTNVIESMTKSLRRLRTVPIEWINSYFDKTSEGVEMVERRPFTILNELRMVERKQDGTVNAALGYFKFDDSILSNLKLNYTKPVYIDQLLLLRSEIAQLLYVHVDLMLFDKMKYERKSRELFDDLGLKNAEYQHMYERRRALEKAIKELQGVRLSRGVLQSATLEKTKDRKDYKIVFAKTQSAPSIETQVVDEGSIMPQAVPVVINDYSQRKDKLQVEAEDLVRYFLRKFHGVENVESRSLNSKQVSQAIAMVAQYGQDAARFIIDFSVTAASETGYRPQTFGGISHYVSRALAALDASQRSSQRSEISQEIAVAPVVESNVEDQELHDRLAALEELDADEYQRLYARAVELVRRNAFIDRHFNTESTVIAQMIKATMLKELVTGTLVQSPGPFLAPEQPSALADTEIGRPVEPNLEPAQPTASETSPTETGDQIIAS